MRSFALRSNCSAAVDELSGAAPTVPTAPEGKATAEMITMNKIQEEVKRRQDLSYTREIVRNSDGTWFARIVEFPGCMTEGETAEEALSNLEDAMALWIEVRLEDGDSIPEPTSTDAYSGKFLVRVPKGLHRELARRAELSGVSLNQYVSVALALTVGEKSAA